MGHYPANNLIPRRSVPRRRSFGSLQMPEANIAGNYPQFPAAMPNHGVGCRRLTHPCATDPPCGGPVRLACLIHAANVHSEPGSNPSQMSRTPQQAAPSGAVLAVSDPHPERVEENAGRTTLPTVRTDPGTDSVTRSEKRACQAVPGNSSPEKHVPVVESRPAAIVSGDLPEEGDRKRPFARRLPSRVYDTTNLISSVYSLHIG